jgi:DNA-binding CsgD family transcriptional regulator/PAS domain-containing protein
MRTRPNIDQLILDIHAAALEPDRWQHVVDGTRSLLNADRAMLFSVPMFPGEEFWHVAAELDPSLVPDYAQEFAREDPWLRGAKRRGTQVGLISAGEELVERSEFLRSRFFNEFCTRYGMDRFLNVQVSDAPSRDGSVPASFSFYRGVGRSAFGDKERSLLSRLTPHLVLAISSFWKTRALSLQNAALSRTLDAVTAPLFLIDRLGRLVFANHAAEAELRTGDSLRTVDGCLAPSAAVRYPKSCVETLQNLRAGRAGTAVLIIGASARTMVLSTAPLSEASEAFSSWGSATGLVWVAPAQPAASPAIRIAGLFGLTHAEERLLEHLAAGASLVEAASTLHVSIHTARTQLKSVQQKTGWHTQRDLCRVVQQVGAIHPSTPRLEPSCEDNGNANR